MGGLESAGRKSPGYSRVSGEVRVPECLRADTPENYALVQNAGSRLRGLGVREIKVVLGGTGATPCFAYVYSGGHRMLELLLLAVSRMCNAKNFPVLLLTPIWDVLIIVGGDWSSPSTGQRLEWQLLESWMAPSRETEA